MFWHIAVVDATPDARTFNEFVWTGSLQGTRRGLGLADPQSDGGRDSSSPGYSGQSQSLRSSDQTGRGSFRVPRVSDGCGGGAEGVRAWPREASTEYRSPLSRGTIELPWESRQDLLEESRRVSGTHSTRDAFEAVGTSGPGSPAHLTTDVGLLEVVIHSGRKSIEGLGSLPDGIVELRNALQDDLRDTTEA